MARDLLFAEKNALSLTLFDSGAGYAELQRRDQCEWADDLRPG